MEHNVNPTRTARPVKYTATFSDGRVFKRSSNRVYTHAWLVTYTENEKPSAVQGFSGSADLAKEAASHWVRRLTKWGQDPRNADKIAGLAIQVVGVQS